MILLTRDDLQHRLKIQSDSAERAGNHAAALWALLSEHGEPSREAVDAFHGLVGSLSNIRGLSRTTIRRLEREKYANHDS